MKDKKMIFCIAIMVIIAVTSCSKRASAQTYDPESDFRTETIDGGKGINITKYLGNKTDVSIPLRIKNVPVTAIEMSAFYDCYEITSITIPNSVTSIKDSFIGCSRLTEIIVADRNTTYSSENGILYNKNKTTIVRYPEGKTGDFTIPDSVNSIGMYAFIYSKLTSVTIPNSVTKIEYGAFCASKMSSITIPASVTSIEDAAFSVSPINATSSLTSVTFAGTISSSNFKTGSAFQDDLRGKFYTTDKENGTPGTYIRSGSVFSYKWARQE